MVFNPSEHFRVLERKDKKTKQMVKSNYLDVKWRIAWYRDTYPKGTIKTKEVFVGMIATSYWDANAQTSKTAERPGARYKAMVYDEEGHLLATGYKTETGNDFPDYQEKAETGAIGRALALAGFGTQFAEDFDEDDASGKMAYADSPVDVNSGGDSSGSTESDAVTECEECKGEITAIRLPTGKVVPPEEIIKKAQAAHSKSLCHKCYSKHQKPAKDDAKKEEAA